jgi:hypothetical protein
VLLLLLLSVLGSAGSLLLVFAGVEVLSNKSIRSKALRAASILNCSDSSSSAFICGAEERDLGLGCNETSPELSDGSELALIVTVLRRGPRRLLELCNRS